MADEIVAVYRAEVEQYKKAVDGLVGKVDTLTKEEKKAGDAGKKAFADVSAEAGKLSPEFARATTAMSAFRAGIGKVIMAMKTLRGAVIATGIGALVVIIASVATAVTKLQGPMDKLKVVMAQAGQVVNILADRFARFGAALIDIATGNFDEAVNNLKAAFTGLGDELAREVGLAGRLKQQLLDIEKAQAITSTTVAKLRGEIDKLNATYGDTTVSLEDQLKAQQDILKLREQLSSLQVRDAEQLLANALGQEEVNDQVRSFIDRMTDANNVMLTTTERARLAEELIKEIGIDESTITDLQNVGNLINNIISAEQERFGGIRRVNSAILSINNQIKQQQQEQKKLIADNAAAKKEAKDKEDKEDQERIDAAFKIAEQVAQKTLELDEFVRQRRTIGLEQEMQEAIEAEKTKALMAEATAINLGASEETIQAIRAASVDEQLRIEGEYRAKLQALEDEGVQAVKDAEEEKKKARQQALQEGIAEFEMYSGAVMSLVRGIMQAQQMAADQELAVLDRNLEQGLISREQYDAERRKIMSKQASDQKTTATFEAILNGVVAVINAFKDGGPVLAAITGAAVAAQIAVIQTTPVPQFAEGVIGLQGAGTETSDSIPAFLSRGESVMTAAETKRYRPLLEGIRKGTLDQIIQNTYVRPAVDAALLNGFADIGKSAQLNASFNDMNLLRAIDRHRQSDKDGFTYLATQITSAMKRDKRTSWN
jgi:hypothetical protein